MQMGVVFTDQGAPDSSKGWLSLASCPKVPESMGMAASSRWMSPATALADQSRHSFMVFLFKQIDYGCRAGEYFSDLLGQQKGARLDFPLLKQGTQEPGLQLNRGRLGHLLFLAVRCRSLDNVGIAGEGEGCHALANSRRLP